ncbi:aminopeptidase [Geothermobacter hydrogeniphilus]|uniref:Aminopeptidase n=1 Tax=Geothermobacter hydrogeniphilus TaxID=1969733 RepID=A0A2K2H739_9BACT|nr:aminopeptidase [Geothermobacter hydrogeniphilus]PNU19071.1 aminopeptidase [Geothermobacter hydrogeniphilus]
MRAIILSSLLLCVCFLLLSGCSDFDYYLQAIDGQYEILHKTRDIHEIIADPQVSGQLKSQLDQALHIRAFASTWLHLPDNDSYRRYADLGRPYVVWNVVATPEFSLQPVTWCFPIAGCVPYRGYFKKQPAIDFARKLKKEGDDVLVYGVQAYSTLNWFDDPLLNTFNNVSETYLAALIFHELAHQQVYLPGDSDFNEAFAKTVEMEGVKRWLMMHGKSRQAERYREQLAMERDFLRLARTCRRRLQTLYASGQTPEFMRREKHRLIRSFQDEVRRFRQQRNDGSGFSAWLDPALNNARFASLNTYYQLVPAFQHLLSLYQGELDPFYRQVAEIADRPATERKRILAFLGRREPFASARR